MKKLFILFLFMLFSIQTVKAEDISQNYVAANKYYNSGNYLKAGEEYRKILKQGISNGYIFYNLGNSYLKLGQTGLAIANYKKAQNFIPREQKLKNNINYLYEKINYEESSLDKTLNFFKLFTFREVLILFSIFWALIFLLWNLKRVYFHKSKKINKNINTMILVISPLLLYCLLAISLQIFAYYQNEAIIVVEESDVKVSNNFSDVTLFKVKENQKVNILSETGDWAKISFENNKGWINKASLEKISVL